MSSGHRDYQESEIRSLHSSVSVHRQLSAASLHSQSNRRSDPIPNSDPVSRVLQHPPAADVEHLTGDEGGLFRGKKSHRFANVPAGGGPAHGKAHVGQALGFFER